MVHAWIPTIDYFFSYNALSWAISTEFGFYILFPLLLCRWNRTWHIKLLSVFIVTIIIIILCNYFRLSSGLKGEIGCVGLLYIHPLGRLFEFTLGMTMALIYKSMVAHYQPDKALGTIAELLVLMMVPGAIAGSSYLITIAYPWIGPGGVQWLGSGGVSCLFFSLAILVMAFEKGLISQLMSWPLFVLLGEMSYSIYLLHQILLRYYRLKVESLIDMPGWAVYTYIWIILLISSHIFLIIVERPCRKFIVGLRPRLKFNEINRQFREGKIMLATYFSRRMIDKFSLFDIIRRNRMLTVECCLLTLLLLPIYYYIR